MRIPSEEEEQVAVIEWLWSRGFFAFHVPNGLKMTIAKAIRLKKMGLVAGIPDLIIVLRDGRILWLEMKKTNGYDVSEKQEVIHRILATMRHTVLIGIGAKDAIDKLSRILPESDRTPTQEGIRQDIVFFPAILGEMLFLQESRKRAKRSQLKRNGSTRSIRRSPRSSNIGNL